LWLTVADEQCGTVFNVEDGSGAYAQVNTSGAHVRASVKGFRELPLGAHDRVRAFLEGRGNATWIVDVYEEEYLRPGDRVTVAGRARREPGSSVRIAYRDAPSSRLIVSAALGDELVVATPEAVQQAQGGVYRGGWIAVLLGIATTAAGFLTQWLGKV
jgi:hypothetical protein